MASGYMYAVQAAECPNFVKIGVSTNPKIRVARLQTGNPYCLSLVWSSPCNSTSITENHFKAALRDKQVRGEWFDLGPLASCRAELAAFLDDLAATIANRIGPSNYVHRHD